jgi:hypothetical protein
MFDLFNSQESHMSLIRFIFMLFAFAGVLAACAVAVLLGLVMLRFLPVLICVVLACMLFKWLLKKAAIRITVDER